MDFPNMARTVLAHLNSMAVYKEGKYEVHMLWQEEKRSFPNNFSVALKRFNTLKQRLERDPDLRKKYEDTVNTYIEKSYTKKLSRKQACATSEKT